MNRTEGTAAKADDLLVLLELELLPTARKRAGALLHLAVAEVRLAAISVLGVVLLLILCAAAILIGWGLVIASLLYTVAEYSMTTWVLTALAVAAAHAVLAIWCWRQALALARNLMLPETRETLRSGDARPDRCREPDAAR